MDQSQGSIGPGPRVGTGAMDPTILMLQKLVQIYQLGAERRKKTTAKVKMVFSPLGSILLGSAESFGGNDRTC